MKPDGENSKAAVTKVRWNPDNHQSASKPQGRLCDVAWYDGRGDIQTATMTPEETLAMNLEQYDYCRAECLGVDGYIDPQTGKWQKFKNHWGKK